MFEIWMQPETWLSLLMLSVMEIVLGIDNVIFISIVVNRLPKNQQGKARNIGLGLALVFRLALLSMLSYLVHLTQPWFTVMNHGVTGRDIVLLGGGLFLMAKTTREIHENVADDAHGDKQVKERSTLAGVIAQVVVLDIVFSFDSVLTAIGLSNHVAVMMIAVIISLVVMLAFSGYISDFIDRNPTMKMLALSFLMLIGFLLVAESFHVEVPKGYIYFAMAFSFGVELLNMQVRKQKS
ncbi:MAG: TerC family protein [Candidatus Kapaibacterium sp.]|nr:MAG: TerC family protein [Candidatus Kapabacteria bacterium]